MNQVVLVKDMIRTMALPASRYDNPVAVVLIGAPQTGKTTLARQLAEKFPITYLSNDQIETYLTPHLNFFDNNQAAMEFAFATIVELIRQKICVVYDFSIDRISDRNKIRTQVEALGGYVIFVYLTCDDSTVFNRIQEANIKVVGGDKRGFILDQDTYMFKKGQIEAPFSEGAVEYGCDDELALPRISSIIKSKLNMR